MADLCENCQSSDVKLFNTHYFFILHVKEKDEKIKELQKIISEMKEGLQVRY